MITQETCSKIWTCHNQIANCKKLIADMKKELEKTGSEKLIDAFGRKQGLELGVPCGDSGHRLFNIRIDLAMGIIDAHILDNENELKRLGAIAEIELKG